MEGPELNPELLLSLFQACGTVKSWDKVFKKTPAQYLWRCEFKFRQGPAIAVQLLRRRMLKNTKITLTEEKTSFLQDIHVIDDVPNYPPFTSAQQISSCDTTSSGMDVQYPLSPLNPLEMNTGEYGSFVSSDLPLSHIIKRKSSPFMEHRQPQGGDWKHHRWTLSANQIEATSQHPQQVPYSSSKVPRTKEELFSFPNAMLNSHIDDWLFGRVA
ncbi:hypothetical protein Pelo_5405 [Pelomyxa schiedti]|nr:hypothetical protein Pelo_5405 [Pelomyxa schiedti]